MKILLVVEAALGGTGRQTLYLAERLAAAGYEVHFVYSPMRADPNFTATVASLSAAMPEFHPHPISMTRELNLSDFRSYLKLSLYVYGHGPFDVIHAHSTKAGFLARLLLNRSGARLVYTPHGLMTLDPGLTGIRRRAVQVLESALSRCCHAVLAVSRREWQCAIKTGIVRSKLEIIPNGCDPIPSERRSELRAVGRKELGLTPETICIGFVGRFFDYKMPGRIVEAFSLLKSQTATPVRLALIGSGALDQELREQVADLGLGNDVVFTGELDAPAYMPALDVLAHASLFEGMSYVFLEALSCGVPIVTTRVGGTEELISRGVTGYVCDPWDAADFAGYLKLLVEDGERRRAMSSAACERASRFTVAEMVERISALYQRICGSSHPAPVLSATYETLPTDSNP